MSFSGAHSLSVVQENDEANSVAENNEYDAEIEGETSQASGIKHELSPPQFSLNVIKAIVGAGSFSLPFAFYQNGIVMSVIMLCALSALSVYTGSLLNYVDRRLSAKYGKQRGKSDLTYPDLAEYIFPGVTCSYVGRCGCCSRRKSRTKPEETQTLLETDHQPLDQLTEYLRAESQKGSEEKTQPPPSDQETTSDGLFNGRITSSTQTGRSVSAQPQVGAAKSSTRQLSSAEVYWGRSLSATKPHKPYQRRALSIERRREIFKDAAFTLTGRQATSTDHSSASSRQQSAVPPEMFESATLARVRTKTDERGVPESMPRPTGAQLCCYSCITPFIGFVLKLLGVFPCACCNQSVYEPAKTKRNCGAGCSSTWCCCGDSYLDSEDESNFFSTVVYIGFVATSLGASAAYVDFISSTLPTIVDGITQFEASLMAFPVVLAMALLRSLRILAFSTYTGHPNRFLWTVVYRVT
eukprot:gb/GECG01000559.1/.p1 GENE.gb/GECG01000559.1/~~gb/GECG01000559.1/.p1  ORF type:complete len:468 (+),score=36.31 gb/GECG01000559.1/:1-1404(+)